MKFLDQEGKVFGFVNIIDLCILLFFIVIISAFLVYLYAPPRVHEQEEIFFQVYFVSDEYSQPFPYALIKETFVPGTELTPSPQGSKLTITNITFTNIQWPSSNINFLVTLNGTVELGSDGQYLFNGYQIAPGKKLIVQINHSSFIGTIQRINYTHYTDTRNVTIMFDYTPANLPVGDIVFNDFGERVGKIIVFEPKDNKVVLELIVDIYDKVLVFNENPLYPHGKFIFRTQQGYFAGFFGDEVEIT